MRMRPLFLGLEAIIHTDRHAALAAAAEAIGEAGGWIVDHTLLSDMLAVIGFQIPAPHVGTLTRCLGKRGIVVAPTPPDSMGSASDEVNGRLSLTFAKATGDLRQDVPAFQ